MIVYHGTTKAQCEHFCQHGIDGHLLIERNIHGPQDHVPGLFVSPVLSTAKGFGRCVVAIEIELSDLTVPPILERCGITLKEALNNPIEPQGFLGKRIEPKQIRIVHCEESK